MKDPQVKFLLLLFLASLAVIGTYAYRVLPSYWQSNAPAASNAPVNAQPIVRAGDPIRGKPQAAKTIIEFGDVECQYCGQINPQLASLIQNRPDVRLVWKDCPSSSHPNAYAAALAARCAGDQGQYWSYHDALMARQDQLGPDLYSSLATELRLDDKTFGQCLADGRKETVVQNSMADCDRAGISELPTFYVNGQTLSGANAISDIYNALNQ